MRRDIQKHQSTFYYSGKKIVFHFWSHTNPSGSIDTVIFLGSGQMGMIPKWVALNASPGTAVVDGLPHREAHNDAHDLIDFSRDYTKTAFLSVLKVHSLTTANVVAISQAAPGVVWLACRLPSQTSNVALVAPLGFNSLALGNTPKARLKELRKRTLSTLGQYSTSKPYEPHYLFLGLMALHVLVFDSRWKVSGKKYATGSSYNLLGDCRLLADLLWGKGNSLTIFVSEQDKYFRLMR